MRVTIRITDADAAEERLLAAPESCAAGATHNFGSKALVRISRRSIAGSASCGREEPRHAKQRARPPRVDYESHAAPITQRSPCWSPPTRPAYRAR
jgi:hypothetical protein